MTRIGIAPNLTMLADEAATQRHAFLGRPGSGKTYASGVLVERLLDAKQQVVIVDPVGTWYGLRLDADGKRPGYAIPVLGGLHGDIPLEPTGGKLVADLLVDTGQSLVLDVSDMSWADTHRFTTAFITELLTRKKRDRSPLLTVWEEAQEFVPQHATGETAKMVGAMSRAAKVGRNFGLGFAFITQRPQAVSKEVLNLSECLFVYQMTGPHERKAIADWVVAHGLDRSLIDALPSLKPGHGFIWSPSWLDVLQPIHVFKKHTFDASSTPTRRSKATRQLAPIDLQAVQSAMAETVERAKQNDPAELRREITRLKAELAKRVPPVEVRREVPVLKPADTKALRAAVKTFDDATKKIVALAPAAMKSIEAAGMQMQAVLKSIGDDRILNWAKLHGPIPLVVSERVPREPRRSALAERVRTTEGDVKFGKGHQRICDSLVWWSRVGRDQPTRAQVAFVARYTVNGHFNNMVSDLHAGGYITYPGDGTLKATALGLDAGDIGQTPAGDRNELIRRVEAVLRGEPIKRVFKAVVDYGPADRAEIAERSRYTVNGHFNNLVSSLHTMGVITYPGNNTIALSDVFDI